MTPFQQDITGSLPSVRSKWPRGFDMRCAGLAAIIPMLLFLACTPLATNLDERQLLAIPKMSPDAVVLETALIRVVGKPTPGEQQFWREVDEVKVPADIRRQLADAGLRCGVIGSHLPDWAKRQLDDQQKSVELEERDGTAVLSRVPTQQRLQCRSKQKRTIPLSDPVDLLTIACDDGDGRVETTYKQAQCGIVLTADPLGDGRIELQLAPQIEHGESHHRWIGQGGDFRIDAGRDCEEFQDLALSVVLGPGQTLAMSTLEEPKGLGATIFGSADTERKHRTILLVRLAQTQIDDLFTDVETPTPIATEVE